MHLHDTVSNELYHYTNYVKLRFGGMQSSKRTLVGPRHKCSGRFKTIIWTMNWNEVPGLFAAVVDIRGHICFMFCTCSFYTTRRFSGLHYTEKIPISKRAGGWGSSPGRIKNFHFSISSKPALGSTEPPIHWVPGTLSLGVKWQGREADHSPPTSVEVKGTWIYTSTPSTRTTSRRSA
jgi:hypothetical protein